MNFNIDLTDVFEEFNLIGSQADALTKAVLDDVTGLVLRNWRALAKRELKSTSQEYLRSIQWIEKGMFKNALVLTGKLPNMIEGGAGAFDMKEGFAKSSKIKRNKDGGWYLTIPFRMGTPGASTSSSFFSAIMPASVHAAAKGLSGSRTSAGGSKKAGGSLKAIQIPSQFAIPKTRAKIITKNKTFEAYKHKSSIFEGVQKNSKTYGKSTQSTYTSFRRVGSNSDPNAFIHKGFKAKNFANKAFRATDFQTQVDNSIDRFLSQL